MVPPMGRGWRSYVLPGAILLRGADLIPFHCLLLFQLRWRGNITHYHRYVARTFRVLRRLNDRTNFFG